MDSKTELDAKDWKLLEALQTDARLGYAELGRLVHLSAPAVAELPKFLPPSCSVPVSSGSSWALRPAAHAALTGLGWQFYRFIGEHGYRLMTSWATTPAQVDAFLTDVRAVTATGR